MRSVWGRYVVDMCSANQGPVIQSPIGLTQWVEPSISEIRLLNSESENRIKFIRKLIKTFCPALNITIPVFCWGIPSQIRKQIGMEVSAYSAMKLVGLRTTGPRSTCSHFYPQVLQTSPDAETFWQGILELEVSTRHFRPLCHVTRRCKFWFCNLARFSLSWEDRLARTLYPCHLEPSTEMMNIPICKNVGHIQQTLIVLRIFRRNIPGNVAVILCDSSRF